MSCRTSTFNHWWGWIYPQGKWQKRTGHIKVTCKRMGAVWKQKLNLLEDTENSSHGTSCSLAAFLDYTSNLPTQLSNTPSCHLSLWYILLQAQGIKIILKTPYRCFQLPLHRFWRSILMRLLKFPQKILLAACNEHSCLTHSSPGLIWGTLSTLSRKSRTQELSTSNYFATHWLAFFKQVSTGFGKNACLL